MAAEPENTQNNSLPTVYALIWRSAQRDEEFNQDEFNNRIPRMMVWLHDLYKAGKLVACGGGGFESYAGGLTLVRADTIEEALDIRGQSPMNEIGTTELLVWDVFYGVMDIRGREDML